MQEIPAIKTQSHGLGDFTTNRRLLTVSLLALAVGALSAFIALALLKLIGLFTNLFFYQRFQWDLASPVGHHLGWFVIVVPIVGGLIIGLMAR
jgi:CIC family chloride channel protein